MKWERTWKGNEETLRRRAEGDKSKKRLVPGLISPSPPDSSPPLSCTLDNIPTQVTPNSWTTPRLLASSLTWLDHHATVLSVPLSTDALKPQVCAFSAACHPALPPTPDAISCLLSAHTSLSSSLLSADDLDSDFSKKKETIRRNSTSSHHAIYPPTSICTHRLWLLPVNCGWRVSAPKDNPPPTLGS